MLSNSPSETEAGDFHPSGGMIVVLLELLNCTLEIALTLFWALIKSL